MQWKWKTGFLALGLATVSLHAPVAIAADHLDGAAVKLDASTDINDVYTWQVGTKTYLAMTVSPVASATSKFSNAAYYTFHTASRTAFASTAATAYDITCQFAATGPIGCWFGANKANYVYGDASATTGLNPASPHPLNNKVKIFAGLRKDQFFFNLDGYNGSRTFVQANLATYTAITPDAAGCRVVPAGAIRTGIVSRLTGKADGSSGAVDFFALLNTLAIVIEIDSALVNTGGNFLSVWAGTYKKN